MGNKAFGTIPVPVFVSYAIRGIYFTASKFLVLFIP